MNNRVTELTQSNPPVASTRRSNGQAAESLSELQARLNASPNGLSQEEAQRRLAQYGYNELPEEKVNPILKFFSYFWGPIPWMIEVAAILSALVQHWPDFGIILALLLVNAVVGFWEEYQAGNTIAALQAKLALQARVKRGGAWAMAPARELIPGDIIRLRIGDIVPADARLLDGDPLQVDQSTLTGESLPVTRKRFWSIRPVRILVGAVWMGMVHFALHQREKRVDSGINVHTMPQTPHGEKHVPVFRPSGISCSRC
jgi:H+-transporting ATPase